MQTKMPRFQLAHRGSVTGNGHQSETLNKILSVEKEENDSRLFFLQSAQTLFGSNFRRLLMVAWFCAARSAAGFGGRRDIV